MKKNISHTRSDNHDNGQTTPPASSKTEIISSAAVIPKRLVIMLTILTLLLTLADLIIHHHSVACFLPEFARYVVISLFSGMLFIALVLILAPIISRKEDYYEH
ncbi:MAG: hypothetical protein B6I36_05040 [Desulfobacteraceae bacterium 4572_35.1]|nr:MAG: hypothetical protein B6I36_05040 [Desulfobacteraceae bacterium 4572_35.1]